MKKLPIYIVLAILVIDGIGSLFKMMMNTHVIVGHTHVPSWIGGVQFVIAILLAVWAYTSLSHLQPKPPQK